MSIRRLKKELIEYPTDKMGSVCFMGLDNDNITVQRWMVRPSAGDSVAFDGKVIEMTITIPIDYPFKAPNVELNQTIFHPNVHEKKMCLDKVNNWHPKCNVLMIVQEIRDVIMYPNTDTALCTEAAELYNSDRQAYIRRASRC
jgi:ubiquitin-protein ligase